MDRPPSLRPRSDGDSGQNPEVVDAGITGSPRYAWFAGVLEGRVRDANGLRSALSRLKALDIVPCDLEINGGRFSFMFDEAPVRGDKLSVERQDDLVESLQRFVEASADATGVESTLRGSLVYAESVVETLFAVKAGTIEPVSRKRALDTRDRELAPDDAAGDGAWAGLDAPFRGKSLRGGLMLLALLLLGGSLLAWQSGYFGLLRDSFFAEGTDEAAIETGLFKDTLTLTAERKLASYRCEIRRGANYPETPADIEALVAAAATTGERAAMNAVADGKTIWLRVVDKDGVTLAATRVNLSALLTEPNGVLQSKIRARAGTVRVELALNAGTTDKKSRDKDESTDREGMPGEGLPDVPPVERDNK